MSGQSPEINRLNDATVLALQNAPGTQKILNALCVPIENMRELITSHDML